MKQIRIEKITLNFGAGKDQAKLEKGMKLLQKITGIKPIQTKTQKRIPGWGLRPGLPIGCKLTLRGPKADEVLQKLLSAKENALNGSQFDDQGNVAFGLAEYIDIPGLDYDPDIGILGLEVCITLTRPGFRIKYRRLKQKKISPHHKIDSSEAKEFMKSKFKLKIEEEGEEE